jgi:hypothetical protein
MQLGLSRENVSIPKLIAQPLKLSTSCNHPALNNRCISLEGKASTEIIETLEFSRSPRHSDCEKLPSILPKWNEASNALGKVDDPTGAANTVRISSHWP